MVKYFKGTLKAQISAAAAVIVLAVLLPLPCNADSRVDYLIDLIKSSGNYRVKVQSIKTLGQIGATSNDEGEKKRIVEALIAACTDRNELVRMTAAAALGTVGDPAALPALEKLKTDKVKEVKQQAIDSIKKIEAIKKTHSTPTGSPPQRVEGGSGGEEKETKESSKDLFYIGLGPFSDKSGLGHYDVLDFVKSTLLTQLDNIPGVKLRPDGETKEASARVAKKQKLIQYTLTGSVGKVKLPGDNTASAEVSIIVLDGDGNVRMMLKGKGAASMEGSKMSATDNEKELVLSALGTAVRGAVESLSEQLRQAAAQTEGSSKGKGKGKKKKEK